VEVVSSECDESAGAGVDLYGIPMIATMAKSKSLLANLLPPRAADWPLSLVAL